MPESNKDKKECPNCKQGLVKQPKKRPFICDTCNSLLYIDSNNEMVSFEDIDIDDIEFSYKYHFTGRIHPERVDCSLNIDPFIITGFRDVSEFIFIDIYVGASQVSIVAITEEKPSNLFSFRNCIQGAIQGYIDLFSFTHGYYYDVEITSVLTPKFERTVFGVNVGEIEDKLNEEEIEEVWNNIQEIYHTNYKGSAYLRHAITDFKLSMKRPEDTYFYCYRAVESICKYFEGDWEKMGEELDLERETREFTKDKADSTRHGDIFHDGELIEITDEERAEAFDNAWKIINTFIEYLNENGEERA